MPQISLSPDHAEDLGPTRRLGRTVAAIVVVGAVLVAGQAGFDRSGSRRSVKVEWGDSLWELSQRHGVDMEQLAAANHMKVSDVLLAGRTITLPGGASGSAAVVRAAAGSSAGAKAATKAGAKAATRAGGKAATQAGAANVNLPSADPRSMQHTFCATYTAPTGPRGQLPSDLAASASRLALRPVFAKWAHAYGVPVDLMEGEAWQESGWSNDAVSAAGARGIGQLMPDTVDFVNQSLGTSLKVGVASDNIRMMAAFLAYLLRATGGDTCRAVASYFQGLGTLQHYGVLPVSQVYVRGVLGLRPRFR
jgi:soluble lytic murein transglycosylase-like protein